MGQETGNVLDQAGLGHEQERGRQDGLNNLAGNALVQTSDTLVLDDLAEAIHDGAVALLGVV